MTLPPHVPAPPRDIRTEGFGAVEAVADVLALLDARLRPLPPERIAAAAAAGRVLADPVVSDVDVPSFRRAAMDGYAVRAADTDAPRELAVVGRSLPGRPFAGSVHAGQAVRIATGAPMPDGADAVAAVETTEARGEAVFVRGAVAAGRNVGRVGEDAAAGREVLVRGRVLRPQDVGMLAAVGAAAVAVVRRPRVALLVTGDELLPPGSRPEGSRVVDGNSPMLAALVARDGGDALAARYVPDRFEAVREAVAAAAAAADAVLVSGGTSVGAEDYAARALAAAGELAVHGIALKPARPTGFGFVPALPAAVAVFLLPGNPVSCLCAYDLFAGRAVRRLGGRPWALPHRRAVLPLAAEVRSAVGRTDYVRVRVAGGRVEPLAIGGASNLSSAVIADGFVLVPAERDGLAAGEAVEVHLYD